MLNIAAFIQGINVPGSRFRVLQYVEPLENLNIRIKPFKSLVDAYPPSNRILRPFWGIGLLSGHLPNVINSYKYDITFFQREMLSTLITLESLTKGPRIFDVDDAIWLHKRRGFNMKIFSKIYDLVICGNKFLADYFSQFLDKVVVLPTPVNTELFKPIFNSKCKLIIGWSGSGSNLKYLYEIEPALKIILNKIPGAKLRIVTDSKPNFITIAPEKIEFIRWSPVNEVSSIQEMTVGIMPLDDSPWSRGKCSFKMLTYMACGVPVVVSPIGMNKEILAKGNIGFDPISHDEWVDAIVALLQNSSQCNEMGQNGVRVVAENYSVQTLAPVLAKILKEVER